MANKPNNPSLWSKAKSLAKQKFDVYPSAYANGWAAKWYKSKGGTWRKAQEGMEMPYMAEGGTNNPGFRALPQAVQQKILDNMSYGGYIPEMGYGGYMPMMQDGGDPDGEMALGQINASIDKLSKLRDFIQPESDLEPWVNSKLTLLDHYTDAVSDYMMYNPEAQEPQEDDMEMMREGGIPQRYKNMGFNKVGTKKQSNRPGKKWMVLAKKGDQYKVVHGGYKGMQDYTQHRNEGRRKNFWNRMGGKNSAKATDPFSPLYWHKRFGTWEEGGELPEMIMVQDGGSIVNFLSQRGMAFDKASRAKMAQERGIKDYDYSAQKNTELLEMLRKEYANKPVVSGRSSGTGVNTKKNPASAQKLGAAGARAASNIPAYDYNMIYEGLMGGRDAALRPISKNDELPQDVREFHRMYAGQNKGKPFGIVSKQNARAYFFDGQGNMVIQDEVGLGKDRGERQNIFYEVQTTPAGAYRMTRPNFGPWGAEKFRKGYDAENFFWMDHTDPKLRMIRSDPSKVRARGAMHGIPTHLVDERLPLFGNASLDDNRMSAGCINCKRDFLNDTYFDNWQDGMVYVTPDKPRKKKQMGGEMPCYECGGMIPEFAYGGIPYMAEGGIQINPANRGKFTAKADAAGMGVQAFARQVLGAPEGRYPASTRRQANFARNAASWKKQEGGLMSVGDEMEITNSQQLKDLIAQGYEFEIV